MREVASLPDAALTFRPSSTDRRHEEAVADQFPSMRWPELRRVLERKPLEYVLERRSGARMVFKSTNGYPDLHLAFSEDAELPRGQVRQILTQSVGLEDEEARELV